MARTLLIAFISALSVGLISSRAESETGRTGQIIFASAEEALAAVKAAAKAEDRARLAEIFGKKAHEIFNTGDPIGDAIAVRGLSERFDQRAELFPVASEEYNKEQWYLVRYGVEAWNLPIPLVDRGKGWSFATEYATDAHLNIRKSLNEIATVDALRALVEAQKVYRSQDRNGDGVLEYAQKFISTPGKKDGLYWTDEGQTSSSPIDGIISRAFNAGYKKNEDGPTAYYGYIYKILTAQGGKTRGGKKSYLKEGRLVDGFAILAYPVKWDASGIATFLVAADGQVWKRNLNFKTESIAKDIDSMDLDQSWVRVDPNLGGKNSRSNW